MRPIKLTQAGESALFLMAGAAAAGLLNGVLGTGGGIVLVLLFTRLAEKGRLPWTERERLGAAVCVMLPVSLLSAVLSAALGGTLLETADGLVPRLLLPGAVGSVAGCLSEGRLKAVWLRRLFAAVTLLGGGWILWEACHGV